MEEKELTSSQKLLRFAIVFFIVIWLSIFITGCAPTQRIDYNFVKVLGVTVEGDTILIDVNSLRPRVYNNYYYVLQLTLQCTNLVLKVITTPNFCHSPTQPLHKLK